MSEHSNKSSEYATFNNYLYNVEYIIHTQFKCISKDEFRYAINNLQSFESPDLYAVTDDTIIILEHFEFDASHSNRKGMVGKAEEAKLQRKIEKNDSQGEWKFGKVNYTISFNDWQANFESTFEKHQKRIDTYVTNIQTLLNDTEKRIVIGFIVENQFSPLVDYDNKFIGELPYFKTKQFSDFVSKLHEVDFIVFLGYLKSKHRMVFLDRQAVNDIGKKYDLADSRLSISPLNNNEITVYTNIGKTKEE